MRLIASYKHRVYHLVSILKSWGDAKMRKIKEIDNIILAYGCALLKIKPHIIEDEARLKYVEAISHLFEPRPNEGRLLTLDELDNVPYSYSKKPYFYTVKPYLEAQDAKTAEIYQQKIDAKQ